MNKPLSGALLCVLLLAVAPAAEAQTYHDNPTIVPGVVPIPANVGGVANGVSVSSASSATNLPASSSLYPAININNAGSVTAYVALGASTTTSAGAAIPAGGNACLSAGLATQLAAITASSTTTLNITQANACIQGAGGGGSGGGGGGGAITAANGSYAVGFSADVGNSSTVTAWTGSGTPSLLSLGMGTYNNSKAALPAQSGTGVDIGGVDQIGTWVVQTTPGTTNGWTPKVVAFSGVTVITVKASSGEVGPTHCDNGNASTAYVEYFTTATPTLGTTAPTWFVPIPAGGGGEIQGSTGINIATGIYAVQVATYNGSSAPATALNCAIGYN